MPISNLFSLSSHSNQIFPQSIAVSKTNSQEKVMVDTSFRAYLASVRHSRELVLVIVAVALLLDNMLLTSVGNVIVFTIWAQSIYKLICLFVH